MIVENIFILFLLPPPNRKKCKAVHQSYQNANIRHNLLFPAYFWLLTCHVCKSFSFSCCRFFNSHDREFHVASLSYKPDFKVMPEGWDGSTRDPDEVLYNISMKEDQRLYEEFVHRLNFNKKKVSSILNMLLFPSPTYRMCVRSFCRHSNSH